VPSKTAAASTFHFIDSSRGNKPPVGK